MQFKNICAGLALIAGLMSASQPARADGRVIASIKPVQSIVAAVMGRTGTPDLLVGGMQSPHGYQLKPSQVTALDHADIVFYIGPGLETFLVRPLQSSPPSLRKIALMTAPGVTLLPPRAGGNWEPDDDAGEAAAGAQDPHVWLDVGNAKAMTKMVADVLGKTYPGNAKIYARNAAEEISRLDGLDRELKRALAPAKDKPFIVFHDAFQYFGRDYGLDAVGSITVEPEQEPSVKRIEQIRSRVRDLHVACVFSEPQFNSRLVKTVIEGTPAKTGVLDENGADIEPGPDLYFTLMRKTAARLLDCLAPAAR